MGVTANVVQLVGLALIAIGLWMQWPWAGVLFAGIGLLLVGVSLER